MPSITTALKEFFGTTFHRHRFARKVRPALRTATLRVVSVIVILSLIMPNLAGSVEATSAAALHQLHPLAATENAAFSVASPDAFVPTLAQTKVDLASILTTRPTDNSAQLSQASAGIQATSNVSPTLRVRAYIDGRSHLYIQGDTVYWHHLNFAAPGRWTGANVATDLNDAAWLPVWPNPGENIGCNCRSSSFVGIPALAALTQTVSLARIQARSSATIFQQPDQSNNYTLIVDFNDIPPSGAAWYELTLTYQWTTPTLRASQALATNECPFCTNQGKVYSTGQGINANNGNYNHQQTLAEIAGIGARLSLEPSYNSLVTGANPDYLAYNDVLLGHGWTHNYNVRLLFNPPNEPTGTVMLIAPRGSQLRFAAHSNGTYTPYPGELVESFTRTDLGGGVYDYHLVTENQYEYVFDHNGRLQEIFDPQDHLTALIYNGSGQLAKVANANASFTFAYDGNGRLQNVTNSTARTATFAYDGDGNLDAVTDMQGRTGDYIYATPGNHLLTEVRDPSGRRVVQTVFDSVGRATAQYDAHGKRITAIPNYDTGLSAASAGAANVVQRQIQTDADDDSVIITVTFEGGVPVAVDAPGSSDSRTQFVGQGINPGIITDPNGNTTTLAWSANGNNLEQVTDALSNTTTMQYDALNNLTQVADALNRRTVYSYTGTLLTTMVANYVDGVFDPALPHEDLITQYQYTTPADAPEPTNLLRAVTDSRGIVTRYTYTPEGWRASVTVNYVDGVFDPALPDEDLTTRTTYDQRGRVLTTTDLLGRVTRNDYDLVTGDLRQVTRMHRSTQDACCGCYLTDASVSDALRIGSQAQAKGSFVQQGAEGFVLLLQHKVHCHESSLSHSINLFK